MKITGSIQLPNNNSIIAPENLHNVMCDMSGKNNRLIIQPNARISNLVIQFPSDNALIVIGNKSNLRGKIRAGYKSKILIGDGVTVTTTMQIFAAEQTEIIIGDDTMFATNNIVRSDDAHAIFDVVSGKRINPSRSITIGAHVWLADDAVVLPGAQIGAGSVIGLRAVVKGTIPNNCVAVGMPAKVTRTNIAWERPNVAYTEPWIRSNAHEQNIDKTIHYWKETNENAEINVGLSVRQMLKNFS